MEEDLATLFVDLEVGKEVVGAVETGDVQVADDVLVENLRVAVDVGLELPCNVRCQEVLSALSDDHQGQRLHAGLVSGLVLPLVKDLLDAGLELLEFGDDDESEDVHDNDPVEVGGHDEQVAVVGVAAPRRLQLPVDQEKEEEPHRKAEETVEEGPDEEQVAVGWLADPRSPPGPPTGGGWAVATAGEWPAGRSSRQGWASSPACA